MLRAQFHKLPVTGFTDLTDRQTNIYRLSSNSLFYPYSSLSNHCLHKLVSKQMRRSRFQTSKSVLICCNSTSNGNSADIVHDHDDDYVEAVVLMSETIIHYRMRNHGYEEETKWRSPGQFYPFSGQRKDPRGDINTIGPGLLRHYPYPTIFLKISCDGDYLLPIIVGESAVEKLIYSSKEDNNGDFPDSFQLTRNITQRLGYKVKMVKVTERVDNIYYAHIYFHKPGKKDIMGVDARPSDAINVAKRCRAPIYVNKQIVLTDAVRMAYGMSRLHDTKSVYDVTLDSAMDGPDVLAEELDMVRNMDLAVKEERFSDAAMWRDRLVNLRKPRRNS